MVAGCGTNALSEWRQISCTLKRRCFDRGSLHFGSALGVSPGLYPL